MYISGTNIFTIDAIDKQADAMWNAMADETKADYGEEHFKSRVQEMKGYATTGVSLYQIFFHLNNFFVFTYHF